MSKYQKIPEDRQGFRKGTKAARVNKAMSTQWQTLDEIQKGCKLPRYTVGLRLYRGVKRGIYQYEKLIVFKINENYKPKPRKPGSGRPKKK